MGRGKDKLHHSSGQLRRPAAASLGMPRSASPSSRKSSYDERLPPSIERDLSNRRAAWLASGGITLAYRDPTTCSQRHVFPDKTASSCLASSSSSSAPTKIFTAPAERRTEDYISGSLAKVLHDRGAEFIFFSGLSDNTNLCLETKSGATLVIGLIGRSCGLAACLRLPACTAQTGRTTQLRCSEAAGSRTASSLPMPPTIRPKARAPPTARAPASSYDDPARSSTPTRPRSESEHRARLNVGHSLYRRRCQPSSSLSLCHSAKSAALSQRLPECRVAGRIRGHRSIPLASGCFPECRKHVGARRRKRSLHRLERSPGLVANVSHEASHPARIDPRHRGNPSPGRSHDIEVAATLSGDDHP